ncbi:valine--tRNA ligase [Oligella ureolytica]
MNQTPLSEELAKSFEPKNIESSWYDRWNELGIFKAGQFTQTSSPLSSKPYTIQFPPPNVTGTLHMGHAFNQAVMDSLIRYHRMLGRLTPYSFQAQTTQVSPHKSS